MSMYRLKRDADEVEWIESHEYLSEGQHFFSPQHILASNPEIIFGLPELELLDTDAIVSIREYSTTSGSIDLLMMSANGDIVLVETKLISNPESTRQVVAQIIDYIKAFSTESIDDLAMKIKGEFPQVANRLLTDVNFSAVVKNNIRTGNFQAIIVGDSIHPNVLGMIESIHSAPHLAFTIHLVDLDTYRIGNDELFIRPSIVGSTVEVERSVIKIEIDMESGETRIEGETPEEEGEGSRPKLSWEEYLSNVTEPSFRSILNKFKNRWIDEISDSINMGTVGFSAGVEIGGERTVIQKVYDDRVATISERAQGSYGIPKELHQEYLSRLKESDLIHDKYLSSGKVEVYFSDIDAELLRLILNAAFTLAKRYKSYGEDANPVTQ